MFVKRPQPSPGTTFRIWITLCQRSRYAHCRQVQARPPLINCRKNSKLVVLNHHAAKTHTTKAPRPPAPFAPPTKTAPARRISRQIKCFIPCHITKTDPTHTTTTPQSEPLRHFHPAQHIRHFRPNSTKQSNYRHPQTEIASFSDKPAPNNTDKTANQQPHLASFLHHTPKTAPKRAPFSAKHKAHNTNKTGQTIATPHKTTPQA